MKNKYFHHLYLPELNKINSVHVYTQRISPK